MLKTFQSMLRTLGIVLGRVNTFVLMTVSFYLILLPMAMIRRLVVRGKRKASWQQREPLENRHYEKQY